MSGIVATLEKWLASGADRLGEIIVRGHFELLHHADAERADLQEFNTPESARQLAQYDAAGNFRPLKTAPNLRRGWKLRLRDVHELRAALDFFYPAMLGTLHAYERGQLRITHLRETLNRQTGMYAVTKKLTHPQAGALIGGFCRSDGRCLKTILWRIEPAVPITSLPPGKFDPRVDQLGTGLPALPLLCAEGCNFLVAAARPVARGRAD